MDKLFSTRSLVEHADQLVSKETLMQAIWPDTAVVEGVLTTSIGELRKLFGETAKAPRFIATEHRRGYRFIAPVSFINPTVADDPPSTSAPPPPIQASPRNKPERKQITLLALTLSGVTELFASLDPEQASSLIDPILNRLIDVIRHYSGTISRFRRNGFVALFGAPIAFEDHVLRACQASLTIQEIINTDKPLGPAAIRPQVQVALHSGDVLVRTIRDDISMSYDAVGAAPQYIEIIEQLAPPGCTIISASTLRLAYGFVETTKLNSKVSTSDLSEPVYLLQGLSPLRGRLQVSIARGLTPFTGRERELQTLIDCFSKTQNNIGQVVFLAGEAGIGKSRLLYELRLRLSNDANWLEGQTLSFGRTMAFHPLVNMLYNFLRVPIGADETVFNDRINQCQLQLLPEDIPYIRYLLGIAPDSSDILEMDPKLRQAELFDVLRRLLIGINTEKPQIVVFEDLHWIDQTTQDFLNFFLNSIPTSRVLCLLSYRPDYSNPYGDRTYFTRIMLTPLPSEQALNLTQQLLSSHKIPSKLYQLINDKTEGNPYFIEEIVEDLKERNVAPGDESLGIPDTIQGALTARIDRLTETSKTILQLAAVIGREFPRRLLNQVLDSDQDSDSHLQALQAAELIYPIRFYPETSYCFKHVLTQEVAYSSLLVSQRHDIHQRVAQTIESLHANRIEDYYEILAYHLHHAECWTKAIEYYQLAAQRATQALATRESLALYEQALDALTRLDQSESEAESIKIERKIRKAKLEIYYLLSEYDQAQAEADQLLQLARHCGDLEGEAEALTRKSLASVWANDFERTLQTASEAISVSERVDSKLSLTGAYLAKAYVNLLIGKSELAESDLKQTFSLSHAIGETMYRPVALYLAGLQTNWQDDYESASVYLTEALQVAHDQQLISSALRCLWVHAIVLTNKGFYDEALEKFNETLTLSDKVGDEVVKIRILNSLGWLYLVCGDLEQALELNKLSAKQATKVGNPEILSNAELNKGDIYLIQNDLVSAWECFNRVHHIVRDTKVNTAMKWRYSMHLYLGLGHYFLINDNLLEAQNYAQRCLDTAEHTRSRKYLVKGWLLQGDIARGAKNWDEMEVAYQKALLFAKETESLPLLCKSQCALAQWHLETNQTEFSKENCYQLKEHIAKLESNTQNPALRASLEKSLLYKNVHEVLAGTQRPISEIERLPINLW